MNPDKEFRLKHGVTTIPNDGTTLYASVFDGVQLVANIPVMINIIVNIQKDAITVLLPEVSQLCDLYVAICIYIAYYLYIDRYKVAIYSLLSIYR